MPSASGALTSAIIMTAIFLISTGALLTLGRAPRRFED